MSKTVTHTRVLGENEIMELIVEGMKRRGYIVSRVNFDSDDNCEITATLQIAMPEVFQPVQEQWNGEK